MPKEKWIAKLHEYGAFKIKKDENGKEIWKPLHRGALMPLDDVAIISKYNSVQLLQVSNQCMQSGEISFYHAWKLFKDVGGKI